MMCSHLVVTIPAKREDQEEDNINGSRLWTEYRNGFDNNNNNKANWDILKKHNGKLPAGGGNFGCNSTWNMESWRGVFSSDCKTKPVNRF